MFQLRSECCFSYRFFQSLNVIESPELRRIFLMLWEELRDSDIPHHSKMRDRIMEVFMEHIETLKSDMEVHSHYSWAHNTYIIVYLESIREDFIHNGYVVWPKSLPFHGGNSTLDWNNTCWDTPGPPTHFKALCRLDWIPARSRSSYRWAPCFCIHAHSWAPWNFAEGMCMSYHDNTILTWIPLLDRVGKIRQRFEQRYIYGQDCIWAPQASYPFWFCKPENKVTFYFITTHLYWHYNRCFPHVVNLACKAVLSAITSTSFAGTGEREDNFFEYLDKDPIATLRKLVNAVRNIHSRQQISTDPLADSVLLIATSTLLNYCWDIASSRSPTSSRCRHTMVINFADDRMCIGAQVGMCKLPPNSIREFE